MRPRTVALICAYADVLTAMFWPGPIDGLTLLTIIAVDALIVLLLLAGSKLVASHRRLDRIVAGVDENGRIREAEYQLHRMTRGGHR